MSIFVVMDVNVDLNQVPSYLNLHSKGNNSIIVRKKSSSKQVLIEKYGEDAYNVIIPSPKRLILYQLCVFILVS